MADNSQAGAAVGVGDIFATDDIVGGPTGDAKWPFAKLSFGALDTAIVVADSAGNRVPVRLGDSPDGAIVTMGATTDAEAAAGNGSVIALLKRVRTLLDSSLLGAPNFATGQVAIGTTATQIVAARATRRSLLVVNHGTTEVFIGASGVTTGTGLKLEGVDGAALTLETTAAVHGIVGAGTQTVSFIEEYN